MRPILVLAITCTTTGCVGFERIRASAEVNARDYAAELGYSLIGVSCSGSDSDGDAYASCTLNVLESDGTHEVKPIECTYDVAIPWRGQPHGCRPVVFTRGFTPDGGSL